MALRPGATGMFLWAVDDGVTRRKGTAGRLMTTACVAVGRIVRGSPGGPDGAWPPGPEPGRPPGRGPLPGRVWTPGRGEPGRAWTPCGPAPRDGMPPGRPPG